MNIYSQKPWLQEYDLNVPAHLHYPEQTLVDLLNSSCQKFPEKNSFIYQEINISYKEVGLITSRIASGLTKMGIRLGDRVGMILPNIPQFGLIYFGILKAGGVVVAINPQFRPREIIEMLKTTGVKILFSLDTKLVDIHEVEESYPIGQVISVNPIDLTEIKGYIGQRIEGPFLEGNHILRFLDFVKSAEDQFQQPMISPRSPAVLQFTGGTTGTPKAAVGLHRNLCANALQFITWCHLRPGDEIILAAIPLYHVYGMVLALCMGVCLGAGIVFWDNSRLVPEMLKTIEKQKITFFPAVPSLYHAINQVIRLSGTRPNIQSLKACISGSAPLHPEIKKEFEALTGSKLMEGYGLSEAPTATHCNPLYGENRPGSIGLPLPDVECNIVEIENDLRPAPLGMIGELLIKGPQVMKSYYKNEEETRPVLKNGWLHTGDIVRMDKEGYFYVIDRKKSLIKVSGFQVWPNEVEQVLSSHPAVKEAGVGGILETAHGEKVIAWVVMNGEQQIETGELQTWCRQYLAAYKIPAEIIFVDSLPRTSVGKVLRRELIKTYLDKKRDP